MVIYTKESFKKEMIKRLHEIRKIKNYSDEDLTRNTVWKESIEIALSMYEELQQEFLIEKEKNENLKVIFKTIEAKLKTLEDKFQNEKFNKRGKKKVSLTEKQKQFIKDLTLNAKASRETIVYLFNQKYNKREKPLTVNQLRTIMNDMELKKPKK